MKTSLNDPTIISAIIGGISTITVAFVSYFLTRYSQNSKYIPQTTKRKEVLSGYWEGKEVQYLGISENPQEMEARLNFTSNNRKIKGEYHVILAGELKRECVFSIEGGFLENRFLQLNYHSKDPSKSYFGSILLILNPEGNQLEGQVTGYSGIANSIGASTLILNKK